MNELVPADTLWYWPDQAPFAPRIRTAPPEHTITYHGSENNRSLATRVRVSTSMRMRMRMPALVPSTCPRGGSGLIDITAFPKRVQGYKGIAR